MALPIYTISVTVSREMPRFASDAMNAHQRGLSIPTVALHYRFEPGQAEAFLRRAIQEYGPENVRPHCTRYIFSLFWPTTGVWLTRIRRLN
jgi:hypothetical protein